MNNYTFFTLAFLAGIMIVIQGGTNAQLGTLLKSPVMASLIALSVGTALTLVIVLFSTEKYPSVEDLQKVPVYLWFTGGLFSALAITLFYFLIPKIGISTAISFGLIGQLFFAAMAAHFGWFNSPTEPLTFKKITGLTLLFIGIILTKTQS